MQWAIFAKEGNADMCFHLLCVCWLVG
jgi:hypothetical protein